LDEKKGMGEWGSLLAQIDKEGGNGRSEVALSGLAGLLVEERGGRRRRSHAALGEDSKY
jgi:hypothetical protein